MSKSPAKSLKMLSISDQVFLLLIILQSSLSQRRIKDGKDVKADHTYMVYLIKAPKSPQQYDAWICGGAIVKPSYIITSAACVEDIVQMYAIAGYKKYITLEKLNDDECTKEMKKKIVLTCVPKKYEFSYDKLDQWSNIDIAVAQVESPFKFDDERYTKLCSYKPSSIQVNYNSKYQNPGYDAIVLGWGHNAIWRQPKDTTNHNEQTLKYAPVLIQSKEVCKNVYKKFDKMNDIIDSYMICTQSDGNINDLGEQIDQSKPSADGCVSKAMQLMGIVGEPCLEEENVDVYRQVLNENYFETGDTVHVDETRRNGSASYQKRSPTRRSGICQNDHGGPLVSWVGKHQYVIGVASVFLVDKNNKCTGPYLFTSTHCNGAFLSCVLEEKREDEKKNAIRSSICDQPAVVRGFEIIRRTISWIDHPDGPADNEVVAMRPQIPLNIYG